MKALVLMICLLLVANIQAQTYTVSPSDTATMSLQANYYNELNINLDKVNTSDTITLGYEVVYNDLPASWDKLLCVFGLCVGSSFPSGTNGTMTPLTGPNKGYMRLTLNPLNDAGAATFRVYVYDVEAPSMGDTLTFIVETDNSVPITYLESAADIKVFPNPVVDQLQVVALKDKLTTIQILNVSGQLVKQQQPTTSTTIDVSDLPVGTYWLKVRTENNAIKTQKFIKR